MTFRVRYNRKKKYILLSTRTTYRYLGPQTPFTTTQAMYKWPEEMAKKIKYIKNQNVTFIVVDLSLSQWLITFHFKIVTVNIIEMKKGEKKVRWFALLLLR